MLMLTVLTSTCAAALAVIPARSREEAGTARHTARRVMEVMLTAQFTYPPCPPSLRSVRFGSDP